VLAGRTASFIFRGKRISGSANSISHVSSPRSVSSQTTLGVNAWTLRRLGRTETVRVDLAFASKRSHALHRLGVVHLIGELGRKWAQAKQGQRSVDQPDEAHQVLRKGGRFVDRVKLIQGKELVLLGCGGFPEG
jgi:hypothetical protein